MLECAALGEWKWSTLPSPHWLTSLLGQPAPHGQDMSLSDSPRRGSVAGRHGAQQRCVLPLTPVRMLVECFDRDPRDCLRRDPQVQEEARRTRRLVQHAMEPLVGRDRIRGAVNRSGQVPQPASLRRVEADRRMSAALPQSDARMARLSKAPCRPGRDASTLPPGVIAVNVWSDSADEAWGIGARNSSGCPVRSFDSSASVPPIRPKGLCSLSAKAASVGGVVPRGTEVEDRGLIYKILHIKVRKRSGVLPATAAQPSGGEGRAY